MQVRFSETAIAAMKKMKKLVTFPRVIFFLKMPRDGGGPAIAFVPPDWGDVSPLSKIAGMEIYVDEPDYLTTVLAGKFIDADRSNFVARALPPAAGVSLVTMEIVEK